MPRLLLFVMLSWSTTAFAQNVPSASKHDTPSVPGQISEPQRDRFRLAPLPLRTDRSDQIGLPTAGPKGLLRESSNEPKYDPPAGK